MLQCLIIHFSLHYLSSGRLLEVKNKGKFLTFSSKSGRGRLREVVAYKRFKTQGARTSGESGCLFEISRNVWKNIEESYYREIILRSI